MDQRSVRVVDLICSEGFFSPSEPPEFSELLVQDERVHRWFKLGFIYFFIYPSFKNNQTVRLCLSSIISAFIVLKSFMEGPF